MLALSGGEMDVFVAPIGEAKAGIAGGKICGLGVTTARRLDALPDIPTLAEPGFPGFHVAGWHGVLASKGAPRSVVQKINRELNAVIGNPAYRERVIGMGAVAAEPQTLESFQQAYRREAPKGGQLDPQDWLGARTARKPQAMPFLDCTWRCR